MTFDIDFNGIVEVTVNDPSAFDRVNEPEWVKDYYGIDSKAAMIEHLAWNAVANGYHDASRLDGFADLEPGVITMELDRQMLDIDHVGALT